jgi:hypothetical protein
MIGARMQEVAAEMGRKHAAALDKALRQLKVGQSLAVGEPHLVNLGDAGLELRSEIVVLSPGEAPPLGTAWTVYGPMTPEIEALATAAKDTDCTHSRRREGPRVPLRHGSSASEVCEDCGAWRTMFHGPGRWQAGPIGDHLERDDEL